MKIVGKYPQPAEVEGMSRRPCGPMSIWQQLKKEI